MSNFLVYYVVFGIVFLVGVVGYWIVSRALRDPRRIYEEDRSPQAPSSARPEPT